MTPERLAYARGHRAVNRVRGQPSRCEHCKTSDPTKNYDWASVSRKFEDPSDYLRLCRSCHRIYDKTRPAPHKLTPEIAAAIRAATGNRDAVGRQFGVSGRMVAYIRTGQYWSNT